VWRLSVKDEAKLRSSKFKVQGSKCLGSTAAEAKAPLGAGVRALRLAEWEV